MSSEITSHLLNQKRTLICIIISIFFVYLIFSPSVNLLYYASDDFRYALGGLHKSCSADDGFGFVKTLGRPIQAYLDCGSYKFGYTLERMRVLRLVSVVLMGFASGLLADLFCSLGFSLAGALFTAGCVFLVPQLYDDAVSVGAIPLPLAIIFILAGYRCIGKSIVQVCLSALLILLALLTYPAMAFFFGTLIFAKLLFSKLKDWQKTRQQLIFEVILFLIVCFVYFAWAYHNIHHNAQSFVPPAYRLDHPNYKIAEILTRFFELGNVFSNLWIFFPSGNMRLQGLITIILLSTGMIFGLISFLKSKLYHYDRRVALFNLGQACIMAVIIFILSNAFYLIIPERQITSSRLLFGTMTAGLMLLFWCICQWTILFPRNWRKLVTSVFIGLFFSLVAYKTNIFMLARALVYGQYLDSIRTDIYDYLIAGKKLHRIHFIIPKPEYPYTRFFLANAALIQQVGYGVYELKWCSLARGVVGEEQDHQAESLACIKSLPSNGAGVTYSYQGEPYIKTSDMLVIERHVKSINYLTEYR